MKKNNQIYWIIGAVVVLYLIANSPGRQYSIPSGKCCLDDGVCDCTPGFYCSNQNWYNDYASCKIARDGGTTTPTCSTGTIPSSGCMCGGTKYTSGYCCSGVHKTTSCSGTTTPTCQVGTIPSSGCKCGGITYTSGYCCLGTDYFYKSTSCSTCTPNCAGKVCGSNGCSGTCGTCTSPKVCSTSGTCVTSSGTDTTKPTLSVSGAPTSMAVGVTKNVVVSATDNKGLSLLRFNGQVYSCGSSTSCSHTYIVTYSNPGTYDWEAEAGDTSYNEATKSGTITVTGTAKVCCAPLTVGGGSPQCVESSACTNTYLFKVVGGSQCPGTTCATTACPSGQTKCDDDVCRTSCTTLGTVSSCATPTLKVSGTDITAHFCIENKGTTEVKGLIEIQPGTPVTLSFMSLISTTQEICDPVYKSNVHKDFKLPGNSKVEFDLTTYVSNAGKYNVVALSYDKCCYGNPTPACQALAPFSNNYKSATSLGTVTVTGTKPSACPNGDCEISGGENPGNCPQDCTSSYCGDGYCDTKETSDNCPQDCKPTETKPIFKSTFEPIEKEKCKNPFGIREFEFETGELVELSDGLYECKYGEWVELSKHCKFGDMIYQEDGMRYERNPDGTIQIKICRSGQFKDLQEISSLCSPYIINGLSYDNFNIILVNYMDQDFIQTVNNIASIFFYTSPFDTYQSRFNIYTIQNKVDDPVLWGNDRAKRSCNVPNAYVIVLDDSATTEPSFSIGSMVRLYTLEYNEDDLGYVFLHEFGHLFGDLSDEYVYKEEANYEERFTILGDNCDTSVEPLTQVTEQDYLHADTQSICNMWSKDIGDCYRGCTNIKYYRSSEQSIMRFYWINHEFNKLSQKMIIDKIKRTSTMQSLMAIILPQNNKKLLINIDWTDNLISIGGIYLDDGTPDTKDTKGNYLLKITDGSNTLYETKFLVDNLIKEAPKQDISDSVGKQIIFPTLRRASEIKFIITTPYYKEAKIIEIWKDNTLVASKEIPFASETEIITKEPQSAWTINISGYDIPVIWLIIGGIIVILLFFGDIIFKLIKK